MHAVFDVVNFGSGWFCTRCRVANFKDTNGDTPDCDCTDAPPRIKLFNREQAEHLLNTLPLAECLAAEE
ncbi:hypothetical protein [Microbulbifer epialgicus]|uniref:Uncharacterized protein n=1 Tax=Microbulbifer epialgicus TaxID=393907 RepID=A0ABV4P0J3_9GAMM